MTQPGAGADAQVSARCYRHPQREALIRCVRCDRPICPECMRPASVGFQCPDDVKQGARTVRAQRTTVGARLWQSPPYVTIVLAALNVLAYVITGLQSTRGLGDPTAVGSGSLFYRGQLFPPFVHDGKYYELLTAAFLHASPLHIGANMVTLAFVGPPIEAVLGRWRFTATYLLAALGGSAAVYAFGSQLGATVGASGAIFGLFGAALVLVRKIGLDAQWLIGIIVLNFVVTFSVSGISKLGHLGGFVTGVLCGLAIGGLPTARARVPARLQAAGLGGVAVLVAVVVVIRSATW
jgi:membrane associated rhomboid family serine protease